VIYIYYSSLLYPLYTYIYIYICVYSTKVDITVNYSENNIYIYIYIHTQLLQVRMAVGQSPYFLAKKVNLKTCTHSHYLTECWRAAHVIELSAADTLTENHFCLLATENKAVSIFYHLYCSFMEPSKVLHVR